MSDTIFDVGEISNAYYQPRLANTISVEFARFYYLESLTFNYTKGPFDMTYAGEPVIGIYHTVDPTGILRVLALMEEVVDPKSDKYMPIRIHSPIGSFESTCIHHVQRSHIVFLTAAGVIEKCLNTIKCERMYLVWSKRTWEQPELMCETMYKKVLDEFDLRKDS